MTTLSSRYSGYIIIALACACIGGLGYLISLNYKKVTVSHNLGFQREARENPYLAAELYLNRAHIPIAKAIDVPNALDAATSSDTLLVLNERTIARRHSDRLIEWMESGGHLIVTAHELFDEELGHSDDAFLDSFGVELYEITEELDEAEHKGLEQQLEQTLESVIEPDDDSALKETPVNQCALYDHKNITEILYEQMEPPIQVDFKSNRHLFDASNTATFIADNTPNPLLQYTVGDGTLTVITNSRIWDNYHIGDYDNAFLLRVLTNNSNKVWFIYDIDHDSLTSLLWNSSKYLIVSLFALLTLFIWLKSRRFGPMLAPIDQARRSRMEHLKASQYFLLRHGHFSRTIDLLRQDIRQIAERKQLERLNNSRLPDIIVQLLGESHRLDAEKIHWAMTCDTPKKNHDLLALVATLNQIRNGL